MGCAGLNRAGPGCQWLCRVSIGLGRLYWFGSIWALLFWVGELRWEFGLGLWLGVGWVRMDRTRDFGSSRVIIGMVRRNLVATTHYFEGCLSLERVHSS